MNVVVDIEALGRGHRSVFAIAFCVSHAGHAETNVFYMPPEEASDNTVAWWKGDAIRSAFLDLAMEKTRTTTRVGVVVGMRMYINGLYGRLRPGEHVTFFSDFPEFDIGMTSAILADYGFFPLYMRDDSSAPAMCVNYNTLLRGISRTPLSASTAKAYEKAGLVRPRRAESHDPAHDVRVIMREVEMVLGAL